MSERCLVCGAELKYEMGDYACYTCARDWSKSDLTLARSTLAAHDAEVVRAIARIEVLQFARDMERKLKANDHKGHWSGMTPSWLLRRLRSETNELAKALKAKDGKHIVDEAADVGNFAMMIADKARALLAQPEGDNA